MRSLVVLALTAGAFVAVGCGPAPQILDACADANGIHAVCGLQNPEDLALVPDSRTLILSQFGLMDGSRAGNLALFDLDSEAVRVAFEGGDATEVSDDADAGEWGDAECPGPPPPEFSPHGIDLAERPDGRLQLLVVNHGGRESIEVFEVERGELDDGGVEHGGGAPRLRWRGCVIPPPNSYLNDVVALPEGGLLATHMMPRDGELMGMLRGSLGFDTGHVLEWRPGGRWRDVPGTTAPFPNGIELSADGRSLYLNAYMAGEVRRIDRETGERLGTASVPSPDNSAWGLDGRLLVASHRGGVRDQTACYGLLEGACPMAFEIVAIDPETMETETIFAHAGAPMGAGTVALDLGDELVIGSFAADRLIRVPRER